MKNTLTRLMETSYVAVVKNCFARKEDCDKIAELRTAKRTKTHNQRILNLTTNQRTLWKHLRINGENIQISNLKKMYHPSTRFTAKKYRIKGYNDQA